MKNSINRKKYKVLIIAILCIASLIGCSSKKEDSTATSKDKEVSEGPKRGGDIKVAFQSAPENFDPDHPSSDWVVTAVTNHVYEGLFEFNGQNEAVPHLAKSYELKDDNKTYNIKLREGVKFQDGSEMTSEDVKASLERWFKVNPGVEPIKDDLESIDIINDYELDIKFDKVYAPFINILGSPVSRQKLLIKKKEIVDKFGESIITEHIGTGPYFFDNIVLGQKVVLKRNDNYTPLVGVEASDLAGERNAYLDSITIEFVPEESVRVAGLKSGQFDFIDELSSDRYSEIEEYPEVKPVICNNGTMGIVVFNSGQAPFKDVNLRKAVAYAIDPRELAAAQIGDEKFWTIEDGSWFPKGTIWNVPDAGKGIYDSKDIEKAKKYIEESKYNGEIIKILSVKEDVFASSGALVLQDVLKGIGLNVEVEFFDRSTYFDKINEGDWDIHFSRWSDMNPDPQVFEAWAGTDRWLTNWDDAESKKMDELFVEMASEVDFDKRYKLVEEFHRQFWDNVPYFKVFNDKRIYGIKDNIEGYVGYGQPFFWNVWIKE